MLYLRGPLFKNTVLNFLNNIRGSIANFGVSCCPENSIASLLYYPLVMTLQPGSAESSVDSPAFGDVFSLSGQREASEDLMSLHDRTLHLG